MATHVAYQFPTFHSLPLVHGLSGRVVERPFEGDVGHGRGTTPAEIEANRTAFLDELGIVPESLTVGRQTHGSRVARVDAVDRGRGRFPAFDGFPETDALITNDGGTTLGVIVADCVPIVVYDPDHHAVGVVHAGWRGTVGGIVTATVEAMRAEYETEPETIIVGIGPSIGPCCYEVGREVIDAWRERADLAFDGAVVSRDSSYHFDLWSANQQLLTEAGVRPGNIETSGVCVRCNVGRYFSYRASSQGVAHAGRMLMIAQLQPQM